MPVPEIFPFGRFTLNGTLKELRREGGLLPIEPRPLEVLQVLVRAGGGLVTKDQLLQRVWHDEAQRLDESVITSAIRRLRQVLQEDRRRLRERGLKLGHIVTVQARGYRFNTPLIEPGRGDPSVALEARRRQAALEAGQAQARIADLEAALARQTTARLRQHRAPRHRLFGVAGAALLMMLIMTLRWEHALGEPRDAVPALEEGPHAIDSSLNGHRHGDPPAQAWLLVAAGRAHYGRSEWAEAEAAQREALNLFELWCGPDDPDTLVAEYDLARTLDVQRKQDEAATLLALADSHAGARLTETSDLAMRALWARASHELVLWHPAVALPLYHRLDQLRRQLAPDDAVWKLRVLGNEAWCEARLNHPQQVLDLLKEVMSPAYSVDSVGLSEWAKPHMEYALALSALGEHQEAQARALEVVRESQRLLGPRAYLTGLAWDHVANIRQAAGRYPQSLEGFQQAYSIFSERVGPGAQTTLVERASMAELTYINGHLAEALTELRAVHTALAELIGPDAPFIQGIEFDEASVLTEQGHAAQAAPILQRLDLRALSAADASGHWEERLKALQADILIRTGHVQEGRRELREALRVLRRAKVAPWIITHLERELAVPITHHLRPATPVLARSDRS